MASLGDTYHGEPEASQAIATSFLGPPYVGWIIQFILFGIFLSNFGSYISSKNHSDDSRFNRVYIWTVAALVTAYTGLCASLAFYHGVSQNRTQDALYMETVPDALMPLMVGTIGAVVQSYLIFRAARLFGQQRLWRAVFLCVTGLCVFVGWLGSLGACIASLGFTYGFADKLLPLNYNIMIGTFLCLAAAIDITVTVTLWLAMRKHVLGFNEATDSALRRIMRVAAQTAAYTSFFGVAGALMSVVFPQEQESTVDILFAFDIPLPALYALSLLTTLDSRKPIARAQSVAVLAFSDPHSGSPTHGSGSHSNSATMIALTPMIQKGIAKLKSPLISSRHHSPTAPSSSPSLAGIQVTREVISAVDKVEMHERHLDCKHEMHKRRQERHAEGSNQGWGSTSSSARFEFD